jgi:hypothetical protein
MFCGTTIEELMRAVEKVESESRAVTPAVPVRVTRYDANPGFVYAMQFTEPSRMFGAA